MTLLKRLKKDQSPAGGAGAAGQPPVGPEGSTSSSPRSANDDVKDLVQQRLQSDEIAPWVPFDLTKSQELRRYIDQLSNTILVSEGIVLPKNERKRLIDQIVADLVGFGPLEPLLADNTVTEIMINSPKDIYIVRKGIVVRSDVSFEDCEQALAVLARMIAHLGERLDAAHPIVAARLPDALNQTVKAGSTGFLTINAVIDPISASGPTIYIGKWSAYALTVQNLIDYGSVTIPVMEFLRACVIARANIVVSGGRYSGKTMLLNVLSGFIPADERIVTIEHIPELRLAHQQVISLFPRQPDSNAQGAVTVRDLIAHSALMRPDRIVLGELRAGEALELLQLMARGYDGSMATLRAATPSDALARLEVMALMSGIDWPARNLRELIASTVNLIVHVERLNDGSRKVIAVSEVQGIKRGAIKLVDIFQFEQTGVKGKKVVGSLRSTGLRPKFMNRIVDAGIQLPPSIFETNADPPGG